jgi:hypothetical protein
MNKDLLKYGAVAGAALFVWWKYGDKLGLPSLASVTSGIVPDITDNKASDVLPSGSEPVQKYDIKTAMQTAKAEQLASGNLNFNGDLVSAQQWGWLYQQVRGVPAPNPEQGWPGQDAIKVSLDEYIAKMGPLGLAGLGRHYVGGWSQRKGRFALNGFGEVVPYQKGV